MAVYDVSMTPHGTSWNLATRRVTRGEVQKGKGVTHVVDTWRLHRRLPTKLGEIGGSFQIDSRAKAIQAVI